MWRLVFIVFIFSINANFQKLSLITDDQANSLVQSILKKLCKAANIRNIPRTYFIVDDSLNAFATGTGEIFIHTGTFHKLENVQQLYGILAHELGHIHGGHIHRFQQEKNIMLASSLIGTLIGGAAAIASDNLEGLVAGILAGNQAGMQQMAGFSRTHEKEADAAAYRFMKAAKLEPSGMVSVFQIFQRSSLISGEPYLRTHPADSDRIAAFKSYIKDSYVGGIPSDWQEQYEMIRAKFFAFLEPIKKNQSKKSPKGISQKQKQLIQAIRFGRQGNFDKASAMLNNLKVEKDIVPYINELLGQFALESGRVAESQAYLLKAHQALPKASAIKLLYAQSLCTASSNNIKNLQSNAKKALVILNQTTLEDPYNIAAWLTKVQAYRALKQNDYADYAHAEAAYCMQDFKIASAKLIRVKKSKDKNLARKADELLKIINQK